MKSGRTRVSLDMMRKLSGFDRDSVNVAKEDSHLNYNQIFSLAIAGMFSFLLALGFIFFFLNDFTSRAGESYRMSLQSRYAFGTEPSSLTIFMALLVSMSLILILNPFFYKESLLKHTRTFLQLLLPSGILLTITMSQFFFGKIDLRSSEFSISKTLEQVWTGNFWTRLFSYGMTLTLAIVLILVFQRNKCFQESDSIVNTLLPWWIPLTVDLSFMLSSRWDATVTHRYILWFTLATFFTILVAYSLAEYHKLSKRSLVAFVAFLMLFF